MLSVFFGADTFRSRAAYVAARDDAARRGALSVLRGAAVTPERLATALTGQPLFGASPAVAVEELTALRGTDADAVVRILERAPEGTRALLWERGVPDGRSKVWKCMKAHAGTVEEFPPLPDREIEAWIADAARARGGTIARDAVRDLARACGNDLWTLSREMDKLLLVARGREVTSRDVSALTPEATDVSVFGTVRALATGDGVAALRFLAVHRKRGDDPRRILALTIRDVRALLVIRDLLDRGDTPQVSVVASVVRVPPFVAERLLGAARRATATRLRALFDRLVVALYQLNTGRADPDDVLDSVAFRALPSGSVARSLTPRDGGRPPLSARSFARRRSGA